MALPKPPTQLNTTRARSLLEAYKLIDDWALEVGRGLASLLAESKTISTTVAATALGGTVTSVSASGTQGVSVSVATPATTPALTIGLGAITPASVAAVGTVTGSNLSGTNTGDQTITLTGDVTGSGTGSFPATVARVPRGVSFTGGTAGRVVFVGAGPTLTDSGNLTWDNTRTGLTALNGAGDAGFIADAHAGNSAYYDMLRDGTKKANVYLRTDDNMWMVDVTCPSSTNIVALTNGGKFGIGTSSLSHTLEVSGTINASGAITGSNLSGTNTGDQTITLTGDVTGSGTGSFTATIATNAVSNAKFRQSGALSVVGRSANSTGNAADITATAGSDNVLRESGSVLGFGTITAATIGSGTINTARLGSGTANSGTFLRGDSTWVAVSGILAIGSAIGGATAGSVLYADASAQLAQDNANFFWDGTNHRLGIGTAAPSVMFHAKTNAASTDAKLEVQASGTTSNAGLVIDATSAAFIDFDQSGTKKANIYWSTADTVFYVVDGTLAPVVSINNGSGKTGIGTNAPKSKLDVNGSISAGTYGGANAAPSNGMIISGAVGIGTTGPQSKFDVAGSISAGSYGGVNAAPANGMIISGSVGIGNNNPGAALHVSGSATAANGMALANLSASGYSALQIRASDNTTEKMVLGYANASVANAFLASKNYLYTGGADFYLTKDAAVASLTLTTTGYIGIGTASPSNYALHVSPPVATTGSIGLVKMSGAAHTGQTASTELPDVDVALNRTVQFATGAITTQRAMVVRAPTYGFVGASTITNAATLAITGAPSAGTNATLTNKWALWIQAGESRFDAAVDYSGIAGAGPFMRFPTPSGTPGTTATPAGWLAVTVNGSTAYLPYYT